VKTVIVGLISVCLVLAGCTTTRMVPVAANPSDAMASLRIGERVSLTMKTGELRRLRVTALDTGTITGENLDYPKGTTVQVALADVQSIAATRFSGGKTAGLSAGVILGLAALAAGALLYSLKCGDNDDCS
jgi:hypothetical protein